MFTATDHKSWAAFFRAFGMDAEKADRMAFETVAEEQRQADEESDAWEELQQALMRG